MPCKQLLLIRFSTAFVLLILLPALVATTTTTTSSSSVALAFAPSPTSQRQRQSRPPPERVVLPPSVTRPSVSSKFTTTTILQMKATTQQGLQGQTVFLTGATGGLGTALAMQCAAAGVQRLLVSARKADALTALQTQITQLYPAVQVDTFVCDLANAAQVQQVAAAVAGKYPDIDCLINNGGVSSRSSFLDTTYDVDARVMQINFLAGCAFCKALVPGMLKQAQTGGDPRKKRIIWISSVQGLVGIPNRSSYAASKFAVQGYTEALRAELKQAGVTVHTVSPGYINTNLSNAALTGDGSTYGQTDATTAAGADPETVAIQLLDRIVTGHQVDFTIAATPSAIAAIYLRTLCPALLRRILVKRFAKESAKAQQPKAKDD